MFPNAFPHVTLHRGIRAKSC